MIRDKDNEIVPFKYDNKLQICDILKKTKHLIKSTNKYCNYMQKYTYITQTTTFKLPEITSYPILKNNELIPLNKTTFEFFRPKSGDTNLVLGETGTNFLKGISSKGGKNYPNRPNTQNEKRTVSKSIPSNNFRINRESNVEDNEKEPNIEDKKLEAIEDDSNKENLEKSIYLNKFEQNDVKENTENNFNKYCSEDKFDPSMLLKQNIQKINRVTSSLKPIDKSKKFSITKPKEISDLNQLLIERINTIKNNNPDLILPTTISQNDDNNTIHFNLKSFNLHLRSLNENSILSSNNFQVFIPFDYIPIIYALDNHTIVYFIVVCFDFNESFNQLRLNINKFMAFIEKVGLMDKRKFPPIKHFNSILFHWITPNKIFEVTFK